MGGESLEGILWKPICLSQINEHSPLNLACVSSTCTNLTFLVPRKQHLGLMPFSLCGKGNTRKMMLHEILFTFSERKSPAREIE